MSRTHGCSARWSSAKASMAAWYVNEEPIMSSPSRNILRWRSDSANERVFRGVRSVRRCTSIVHQMQVAEQQHVLLVERGDGVRVDELAVEGVGLHGCVRPERAAPA